MTEYDITSGVLSDTVAFRCTPTFKQKLERAHNNANMDEANYVKKAVYNKMVEDGIIKDNE